MAANPNVASMPVAAPLPPLSLHQILLVYLIVFQEALFGYPVHEFNVVKYLPSSLHMPFPVCLFTSNKDSTLSLPDMSQIDEDHVYRAWLMQMKCDTFCTIMQPFVKRLLQGKLLRLTTDFAPSTDDWSWIELLGLSSPIEWIRFLATPEFVLVLEQQDPLDRPGHSSLAIIDAHGKKYIFDGTIDQYGRNWRTHWLMTEDEFMGSHVDLSPVPPFQGCLGGDNAVRAEVMDIQNQHGYLAVASMRMGQIFQEVDWASLRGRTEDEMEVHIRLLSMVNLVGAELVSEVAFKDWSFLAQEASSSVQFAAARVENRYWAFAFERLTLLFRVLDWEILKDLRTVERIGHVESMTEGWLAGFHKYAFRFG
ncbi:hypothetical protein G6011_11301 [Alternaria panax]|uniref:Uncharacterized protein n=1 Tax=Alternaria panax TaxID=48097 RepID=A0AAD4ID59_9PLEO|nr:hypothetical protein G6011_11301 [Alternaria panax]